MDRSICWMLVLSLGVSGCSQSSAFNEDEPFASAVPGKTLKEETVAKPAEGEPLPLSSAKPVSSPLPGILPELAPEDRTVASSAPVSLPASPPPSKPQATVVVPKAGSVPPAVIPEPAPLEPREMELLIPEKQFQTENGAVRVSFDDIDLLKVLNAEPVPVDVVDHFPKWLKELDGKTIRLKGWMFPPPIDADLPAFLFVRDNQICCFGRRPKVYDKLGVKMKEGTTTDYIQGHPFDVIGTLVFKPRIIDGQLDFLYMIVDATVIDE